jgi:hypothetical protein
LRRATREEEGTAPTMEERLPPPPAGRPRRWAPGAGGSPAGGGRAGCTEEEERLMGMGMSLFTTTVPLVTAAATAKAAEAADGQGRVSSPAYASAHERPLPAPEQMHPFPSHSGAISDKKASSAATSTLLPHHTMTPCTTAWHISPPMIIPSTPLTHQNDTSQPTLPALTFSLCASAAWA